MNDDTLSISIDHEPIELFKVLKIANLTGSGGEAKAVIAEGRVTLNGVIETQRRKKVMSGDQVAYKGARIRVVLSNTVGADAGPTGAQ